MKPIAWIILAVALVILAIPTMGLTLIFALACIIAYLLQKSIIIYAVPNSGDGAIIMFKRSVIENKNITEEDAYHIIEVISNLVEKNKAR